MAGSITGTHFQVATFGESHGPGLGVIIDGCPAGISISAEDIQQELNRRKPGTSKFTTSRSEGDQVEILSGILDGVTTGNPISMLIRNQDQRSKDYSHLENIYRPGHADFTFDKKYGFRDIRGGGRSSGRETVARVAAGAIAKKILSELGVSILAYTRSIGPIKIDYSKFDEKSIRENLLSMPDPEAALKAADFISETKKRLDSVGGVIECVVNGMPAGVGEPVFEKLDAMLAKAVVSIGAVKGFEVGSGFNASNMYGSEHNDQWHYNDHENLVKDTNNAGGILGGISDGAPIIIRAAFKPTPSIAQSQQTITKDMKNTEISIHGRHDPIIVPRAVVVVESMVAITLVDSIFSRILSRMDLIKKSYDL
ncbi:MAG: chorismate synthase [Clostridiaceae bacterium]|nr:chorismate synthase [Clostridiaceae bacterium]